MKIYDALGGELKKLKQYVKQHGVEARLQNWENKPTLLMFAVQERNSSLEVIRFLVEHGADINQVDMLGRTP